MEKKKIFTFKRVLAVYAAIWLIATIVISVKLWNVLADYQSDFDKAKANSNPDLVAESLLHLYSENEILADDAFADVSAYENEVAKNQVLVNMVQGKKITYKRNDKYKDRKPSYDILADGKLIGILNLKQKPESDNYGFHMCELADYQLFVELPELKSISIEVMNKDSVFINDKELTSEYAIENNKTLSAMTRKAMELTGVNLEKKNYIVSGMIEEPKVEVVHGAERQTLEKNQDGVYALNISFDDIISKDVQEQILKAGETYIMNANQMASFNDVAQYLENNSKAYDTVKSVQSGLAWAGKPDELSVKSSEILEIKKYTEDILTVKTQYKTHRLYRQESYEEDMTYEWLYVLTGDKWVIRDFSLAN